MDSRRLLAELKVGTAVEIERTAATTIANKWLKLFCPGISSFKRERATNKYLWESVEFAYAQDDAIRQYELLLAPIYYLMEDGVMSEQFLVFEIEQKPNYQRLSMDFYLLPKNFAWTMCFTHEDGYLRRLFALNSNYPKLNQKKY